MPITSAAIPAGVESAMRRVVTDYWEVERADSERNPSDLHVFHDLVAMKDFLGDPDLGDVRPAMQRVVAYAWASERAACERNPGDEDIFHDLVTLKDHLADTGA